MQHRPSEHQYTMQDFQIRALRWSIAALERLTGITRQAMQSDIDCDKEVMETLKAGGSYDPTKSDN